MTFSNEKMVQNKKEEFFSRSNIFDSHYYKVYKFVHNFNGSWPYQTFFQHLIVIMYENIVADVTFAGQVTKTESKILLKLKKLKKLRN